MLEKSHNKDHKPPVLYGLILAGGKSSRMGRDKALISYHGRSQWEILFDLAQSVCDRTFLSLRKDQQEDLAPGVEVILDRDEYPGPFNGILSAHHAFPDAAWLVLACDLPLIDLETLEKLCISRHPERDATALATRATGLPEPLAAIWEPGALRKVPGYLKKATSSCPRKFLLSSDTSLVFPEDDAALSNANSQEDYIRIKESLDSK
ncbi:molybdopterin-guanine dinucleotide biosynthesis protein A [Muriicola jejuensis]|uniref:Probable molybdenum cofactor guanylyltransferase n=1 Tax=Muriicola jejuensis TaxID=504488 RepID=A0A6P0UHI7_9FLAO|nr:NTP transferase domain-containing protein [Muriicola jejuensis]NER11279.1 NTP transferase domain-containing protein [Muriicola jejuensis]SMP21786.1 molybdopterin-guanine dinucleotide biosynthesis protein A [Muriicola jejuensis]